MTTTTEVTINGWTAYSQALDALGRARDRYDRDSEHGYPAKAAAAVKVAETTLSQLAAQYPAAGAYAKIVAFANASNDVKATCGHVAMTAVDSGADPIIAAAEMESQWSTGAIRSTLNS